MSKVTMQRARKNWRCSKCGKFIHVGETYYALKMNFHPVRRRCLGCKFKAWECSGSEFVRTIGRLQEYVSELNDIDEETYDYIVQELESLSDEMESKLYNIPENLSESEMAQTLEDRIDTVNDAVESIESLSEDEYGDIIKILQQIN